MPRRTLLIGFGGFGLDALQRLLHQSALRGVLRWQQTQIGGVASAQRRLEDLALLALPDPYERSADRAAQATAGAPQFLTDLYRQIKALPADAPSAEGGVAQWVRHAADALMAQTAFQQGDPVGLDLIVLARPTAPETLPHLDLLLQECLKTLADARYFQVAVQGAENLNCILLLDFDDYWCGTGVPEAIENAQGLRAALRNSMQGWERRRAQHQVAVDRLYLVDGRTAAGYRPATLRLDEVVLFLELLLFEGLRAARQTLYQQQSLVQPITATFGLRLLEESSVVLSREAAATFGRRWLDALIGDQEQCQERAARRLHATLEPYRRQAIARRIDDARLDQRFDTGAERLVKALMAVPDRHAADWPERVQAVFEGERQALQLALDGVGWEIVSMLKEAQLKDLEQRVADAVDADLHDERAPASLTLVREAIDGLSAELSPRPDDLVAPALDAPDPLLRLRRLHERYREQHDEWLTRQGRALQWFWPLFALLLALGLAPLTVRVVGQIRPPGPGTAGGWMGAWPDQAVTVLQGVNHSLTWTLVWFLVLWLILALLIQPRITVGIQRAQRFFTSTERGRFHDHCRDLVGPLRDALLGRVRRNIRSSLASDVLKTLSRLGERLRERGREMDWLRRQLNEFLRLSGQPSTAVRTWVSRDGARDAMLEANPPIRDRICYRQEALPRPFAGWNAHFCDAFLDPLRFIDTLSKPYANAYEHAMQQRRAGVDLPQRHRDLVDFIDHSHLALACRFMQDTGVNDEQRWCIAAQRWRAVPGIADELNNRLGIVADDILPAQDRSRVYLLTLQTGIAAANLEREP